MIEESKILDFIKKNDKRYGSVLDNYNDVIVRLINEKISLNSIYEFLFENDNKIGNKANFYKYCKRFKSNIKKTVSNYPKEAPKQEEKKKVIETLSPTIKTPLRSATSLLSQDFNLLD